MGGDQGCQSFCRVGRHDFQEFEIRVLEANHREGVASKAKSKARSRIRLVLSDAMKTHSRVYGMVWCSDALHVQTHYLSCGDVVGPRRKPSRMDFSRRKNRSRNRHVRAIRVPRKKAKPKTAPPTPARLC